RRRRSERRSDDHPDRLCEGDQSRTNETDDREDGCGGRLYHCGEDGTRDDGAEAARHEPLQRTPERVAGESFEAFGEVMDSEQEQAESTQDRYGGGGIHRLRRDSNSSNVEQNQSEIYRAKAPKKAIS